MSDLFSQCSAMETVAKIYGREYILYSAQRMDFTKKYRYEIVYDGKISKINRRKNNLVYSILCWISVTM